MCPKNHSTARVPRAAAILLPAMMAMQIGLASARGVDTPEAEPNNSKSAANPVADMMTDDAVIGETTGSSASEGSASLDTFRIRTAARSRGIYRHRLRITTTGAAGHVGSLRGLPQSNGEIGTGDISAQTSSSNTSPPRYNQWYGFGRQEEVYYRITGTSATTDPYRVALTTDSIDPIDLGSFRPGGTPGIGNLRIMTTGQGHMTDTELLVYDSDLNALVGFLNDDEPAPGGTLQSKLTRAFPPGMYFLAISNFNSASNLASPADDRTRSGNVLDFANAVANSSSTTDLNLAFAIVDASGTHQFAATKSAPYEVLWRKFTVLAEDCNTNGINDEIDITSGASADCNTNDIPDECDIHDGEPDCNSNGVPDICEGPNPAVDCNNNGTVDSQDIMQGTSQDVDVNGIPDECSFWITSSGDWGNPMNWDPPLVPNNPVGPGRGVTIGVFGAEVLLDINARIDSLRMLACTQLLLGGGNLRIATPRGIFNQSLIRIANDHALVAESAFTIAGPGTLRLMGAEARIIDAVPGALVSNGEFHTIAGFGEITASVTNFGTIVADVPGQVLLISGPGAKINDGLLKAANGGILRITTDVHDNPLAGKMLASGGDVDVDGADDDVTVDGDGPVDVEPGSPGLIRLNNAHLVNASHWRIGDDQTGPGMSSTIRLLNNSSGEPNGPIAINRNGVLDVQDGIIRATDLVLATGATLLVEDAITLRGDLSFAGEDESRWHFGASSVLAFENGSPACEPGPWNALEVGGRDVGPDGGAELNFELSALRVAARSALLLTDARDNGNRDGPLGMAEALYADSLMLEPGAVLHLNGLHLYVDGMRIMPGPSGGGMVRDGPLGIPGDVNHDTQVDGDDIGPFVFQLFNGGTDCSADIDVNGTVDLMDLQLFVQLLLNE